MPKTTPEIIDAYNEMLTQRVEFSGTHKRIHGQNVQMSSEPFNGSSVPPHDLPERPVFQITATTTKTVERVTGWTFDENSVRTQKVEEFTVEVEPAANPHETKQQ